MSVDLSILIVSFNTKDYLDRCIDSIFHSKTAYSFEVVVVDNNSHDGSSDMVAQKYPNVTLIHNRFNYGFSVGMNQGFRASKGRFVMSFNPDAELFDNTIQLAVSYMLEHPEVAKAGLATLDDGMLTIPTFKFERVVTPHFFRMMKSGEGFPIPPHPFQVDWIFGTGLIIRRSSLPVDFIYEEKSFLFWEEYYLSMYLRKKGFELHILPHVQIVHHGSVTFKANPHRIYMARLLSYSHEWRVRREFFGYVNAWINFLIYAIDNLLIYAGLRIKSLLKKQTDARSRELADRFARLKSALRILFTTQNEIAKIDFEAKVFFNNGVTPLYPPVQMNH